MNNRERSVRRFVVVGAVAGVAVVAGTGLARQRAAEPVSFVVIDESSGRWDQSLLRMMSDGTIQVLDTTRPRPEWRPWLYSP